MRIEFNVTLTMSDYQEILTQDLWHVLWTHYECMDWLDTLNYSAEYAETLDEYRNVWNIYYTYWIDEHTLDFILLKWPRILEPVRDFEQVRIIQG
jgi:hypothetical protein